MKEYKVYYAGDYDSASLINAESKEEAAYLYFSNNPKKSIIFVETGGLLSEKMISFSELSNLYSDVADILENLGSASDKIQKTLEEEHNFRAAPKEENRAANYFPMKLYTPTQIMVGAFFAGPIAPVIYLRNNFVSLGKSNEANLTIVIGIVFNIVLFASLPFLPDSFPNTLLPLLYSIAARYIAGKLQVNNQTLKMDPDYERISNWEVFWIGLVSFVVFIIVFMGCWILLDEFGVISLA